jgi:hypothetical protein
VIDFRYHIVSLVAVFLALALGLFLGSTTLQSTVTHNLRQQAHSVIERNKSLQAENDRVNAELDRQDAFAAAVEPYAVAGKLVGAGVAVVSAPGVDGDVRDQMVETLETAGATVTADVRLQAGFLDPAQDATWGELAAQLAGNRALPHTNGVGQASAELARALVNRPTGKLVSVRRIETALHTFTDGDMIAVSGAAPVRTADLAVLLVPLGSVPDDSEVAAARNEDLTALAKALRRGSSGLVVAGPSITDAGNGGFLTALRTDAGLSKSVSSVDAAETPVGRVATVLALAAAPGGTTGSYGRSQSHPLPTQRPAS